MDRNAAKAELDAAIAEAWRVFDLPRPATTGVCLESCRNEEVAADFLSFDARDLPLSYVKEWIDAPCSNHLSFANVGWLMPRFMEGMADDNSTMFEIYGEEATLRRLALTGFPARWPGHAASTVSCFASGLFDYRIARGLMPCELDETVCAWVSAGIPVAFFTTRLDALPDATLADALYRNRGVREWGNEIPISPAWWDPGRSEWWAWQTSEALLDRMTRAGLAGDDRAAAVSDVIHRALHG